MRRKFLVIVFLEKYALYSKALRQKPSALKKVREEGFFVRCGGFDNSEAIKQKGG